MEDRFANLTAACGGQISIESLTRFQLAMREYEVFMAGIRDRPRIPQVVRDKIYAKMLAMLDRIHARIDEGVEVDSDDLFNEIGCLIAEAKGEYDPEEE